MTRVEICKKNYNILFGGEALTNTGNDPEMMAILQKYIFGEVFTVGNLDIKIREMITVTSLTVQQTLPQLKAHINAALNVGVTPVELRETIYQCAPFIGFPKTLNALVILNEVFEERGVKTPLESTAAVDESQRYDKGLAIQEILYGNEIKESMKGLPDNMGDDVARFLTEVCFGDFYTRKGLDIKTRELLILSILVTTGEREAFKSHIKGNLKAGNSKETIVAAIIQCLPYVGFPNTLNSLKLVKESK
ncbi:MAG: carboxymuconolactone decarboxylase family protein [Clostridium sp.]|nr:carboxymuconolactone decarboxylase family protein [Clostridium sp.]